MRVYNLQLPRLTLGWGSVEHLPLILRGYATRIAVVTDGGVAEQTAVRNLIERLEVSGFALHVFRDVTPDPAVGVFEACAAGLSEFGPTCVVGIGGGSALDVAKIAAVLVRHQCPLDSMLGIDRVPGRGVPTVLIPTTAGTGSEVTPIAVASDDAAQLKKGIVSERLVADHAIVDPAMCLTLPPWPTAYTGMDALTHAIEAYTNKHAVPLIDSFALEAIRLIARYLPRAVTEGTDREARAAMSRASMLGGMCLGPVNTAAVHAMAYPLGGRFKVPHGVANSLLLPHVARFNMPVAVERYADIAAAMDSPGQDAADVLVRLSAVVGTNRRMRDYGVTEADLPAMAGDALQVIRLMNNNPRPVSEADALEIYQAAL